MIERHGVKGTVQDGVFFTEGLIKGARIIKHLHVGEISRQNSMLSEVKSRLAAPTLRCAVGTA